jgi:hypothetical protein
MFSILIIAASQFVTVAMRFMRDTVASGCSVDNGRRPSSLLVLC